jgi:hypothetical protein
MSDGLQNVLSVTLRINERLLNLLEFSVARQRCGGRSRSRSRSRCPRCGACKEHFRPPSPRRESRAKLLPRSCRETQTAAPGEAPGAVQGDAKSRAAAAQAEDGYMHYVDQHVRELLDTTQRDCQMRESAEAHVPP